MRRLAILSDIHGNLPALEAVLADVEGRGPEVVYCLGDLVGYGGRPNEVVAAMRESGIPTIMGNYDDGVAWERGGCGCFYPDRKAEQVGEASYAFTATTVTEESKAWLRGLPQDLHFRVDDRKLHLVHGSPRRINEYLLPDRDAGTFERLAAAEDDDVLVFGHTHQFWHREHGGVDFVNVPSVGRPKDGDPRAAYAMVEISGAELVAAPVRVDYDVEAAVRDVLGAGLPQSLAESVRRGR